MIHRNSDDRRDAILTLTARYVSGELSETAFMVSLHAHVDVDDIRHIVMLNQNAHRQSLPFKRGELS